MSLTIPKPLPFYLLLLFEPKTYIDYIFSFLHLGGKVSFKTNEYLHEDNEVSQEQTWPL